eukprot:Selendium_serpulae@DN6163_c1_g1_i3.p1
MIQNEESHEDEKRVAIDAQIDRTLKRNRSDAKRAKHTDPKNSDFEFAAMRHLSTRTIGNDGGNSNSDEPLAEQLRISGNGAFKKGDVNEAVDLYTSSLFYCKSNKATWANRALMYLRLGRYHEAIHDCNESLLLDSAYAKAYHHRGKAHEELGRVAESTEDYRKAKELTPNDPSVTAAFERMSKALALLKEGSSEASYELSLPKQHSESFPEIVSQSEKTKKATAAYDDVITSLQSSSVPTRAPQNLFEFERHWSIISHNPARQA